MKKTWNEKIIDTMRDGKWKTAKQIRLALNLDVRKHKDKNLVKCLGCYMIRLVRAGYIERAYAPEAIKKNPLDHVKYVYRWRGKEYKRKLNAIEKTILRSRKK
jgi:uncharacterized LabA/DUF88 family protein